MSHYISNKEFTQAIDDYIKLCEVNEASGKEAPVIPDNIAKQFMALANKLGIRYNFVNYTFRDEMISNAIFACCAKIRKFDIKVSNNAFAYFTNVCWRAMVDVINYEEKMSYIKAKSFQSIDYDESMHEADMSDFSDYSGNMNDYSPFFDIAEYENKMQTQKERSKEALAKKKLNQNLITLDMDDMEEDQ